MNALLILVRGSLPICRVPLVVRSFQFIEETQIDELLWFGVLGCRHGARDIV
jgi:hypothetical protein